MKETITRDNSLFYIFLILFLILSLVNLVTLIENKFKKTNKKYIPVLGGIFGMAAVLIKKGFEELYFLIPLIIDIGTIYIIFRLPKTIKKIFLYNKFNLLGEYLYEDEKVNIKINLYRLNNYLIEIENKNKGKYNTELEGKYKSDERVTVFLSNGKEEYIFKNEYGEIICFKEPETSKKLFIGKIFKKNHKKI